MHEKSSPWPLSMVGEDGPQLLEFEILALGASAPRKPGIFIYARRRAGQWQALYIGESADLSARLTFNEIAADALLSGATDIHVMKLNADAKDRRDLVDRLILTNCPALNEEERIKLATFTAERQTPPAAAPQAPAAKTKSRAA
ncbi:MAG: hypothetical protein K8S25_15730 [Alphaproteobacteria bacterium]|nr:hypothetical protein [Alphaproteobacteria bacterium]